MALSFLTSTASMSAVTQAQVEHLEDSDEGNTEEGQGQAQYRPLGHSEGYPAQGIRMTFSAPTSF